MNLQLRDSVEKLSNDAKYFDSAVEPDLSHRYRKLARTQTSVQGPTLSAFTSERMAGNRTAKNGLVKKRVKDFAIKKT